MNPEIEKVFLLPGDMCFQSAPSEVSTILGSCVAVCLLDAKRKWGGMNHYMLPEPANLNLPPGKIGSLAISRLARLAFQAGCKASDLRAEIHGGADVNGHLGSAEGSLGKSIGERNIRVARESLRSLGIRVFNEDVGGSSSRRIRLVTETQLVETNSIARTEEQKRRETQIRDLGHRKVGVLVVDDSAMTRRHIVAAISATNDMEVVGEAGDPFEARERILERNPDVLCLDLIMPRMNGLEFLKRLMHYKPIPTVVLSTIVQEGSEMLRQVLAAGAIQAVDKNDIQIFNAENNLADVLIPKLRKAARVILPAVVAPRKEQ